MTIAEPTRTPAVTTVSSPMAALVVAVAVDVGQVVAPGELLCVTETMKCESPVVADVAGWVIEIAAVGTTLDAGDPLVQIGSAPPDGVDSATATRPPARSAPDGVVAPVPTVSGRPSGMPGSWRPATVIELLCDRHGVLPETATGEFVELDLVAADGSEVDDGDRLVRVDRPLGGHTCGVVVGLVRHVLNGHPDGLERVLVCGDPTRSMGAVAEDECRRIVAAIDLAEERGVPVEWIAVSSGARIAWDSGTENMDWCAVVARRIVEFTQGGRGRAGGAINIVVAGVNVGAQSYWDALATMLPHTSGMLIMIEGSSMVLTGRRALALSGGGHHRGETEMGGYRSVMGPNGEAHATAPDLVAAYRLLFDHLALSEPRSDGSPARAATRDRTDRSVCDAPYDGPGDATTVGEVLDATHDPRRKQSFAIRPVMAAVADTDAERLERWPDHASSHPAVVWDTRLGGLPVTLIGIESQPTLDTSVPGGRLRASGTLYPQAARKIARAVNAASGRRGVVVLANLAGFDGSAESMLGRQLEYGAEIARAVVNFDGPLVVVVVGRFHGGAYVVFSRNLNPSVTVFALPGTFVSVIGGDAAAGVVFAREVEAAVADDPARTAGTASDAELGHHHRHAIARRFDELHSVERAEHVGSVDAIVPPRELRARIVDRLERGLRSGPDVEPRRK